MVRRSVGTFRALLLIASAVLAVLSGAALAHFNLRTLSLINPSAPIIFDPNAETFSFKSNINVNPPGSTISSYSCTTGPAGSVISNNQACFRGSDNYGPNVITTSSDSNIFTDSGIFYRQWSEHICVVQGSCNTSSPTVTWNVLMPNGLSASTPGNSNSGCQIAPYPSTLCLPPSPDPYGVSASITGSGFSPVPTSGNPDSIPTNPYPVPVTYRSSFLFTNSSGTFNETKTISRTLYAGLYEFTINLSAPSGNGASGLFSLQFGETPGLLGGGPCGCPSDTPSGDFNTALSAMLPDLNNIAKISNSQIAVQVNIPASWISSNLDWFGGYGAWTGAGLGSGSAGDCTTIAGICSTGLGTHASLGIYNCAVATGCGAFPTAAQFPGTNLLTANQICSILASAAFCGQSPTPSGSACSSGLPCTFYISVPIQSFGDNFSVGSTCSPTTLAACFTTAGATMPIPILMYVLGSGIPQVNINITPTLNTGATVTGKVLDGGSAFCFVGCPGLAGVTVSDGPPCNSQGCSQVATTTAGDGTYSLSGLVTGGHTIYYSYPGYNTQQNSGVSLSAGSSLALPTVVLLPGSTGNGGTNQQCLINPQPSSVPGVPGTPGIVCLPNWEIILIFVIATILLAFTIFLVVPSGRKATVRIGKFGAGI